jgi:hypothetical protein
MTTLAGILQLFLLLCTFAIPFFLLPFAVETVAKARPALSRCDPR